MINKEEFEMKLFKMFELEVRGPEPVGSHVDVDLNAVFSNNGRSITVRGFYDGDGVYKIRFYPQETGLYKYVVSGIASLSGEEICEADDAGHGMVRAEGNHFRYDDGSRYLPFGTTVYALVHQDKQLVDQTMNTLSQAPFNKVRMCVFPKHYDFNHNDPEFYPFARVDDKKWDVNKPDFRYWHHLEQRLAELDEMGIQADLIIFHPYDRWGFAELSQEECAVYLDYLTRRLAAWPNIWWSLANEYDLMDKFEFSWWPEFAGQIYANDPWHHLLSNHNFAKVWDFSTPETTHCCLQNVSIDDVQVWAKKYGKPVVYDEIRYEGNIMHSWGNVSGRELVNRFWKIYAKGGYASHGETFMDDKEILWWARGGVLKGSSPERIGFLRQIMEELPGPIDYSMQGIGALSVEAIEELQKNPPEEEVNNGIMRILRIPATDLYNLFSSIPRYNGNYNDEVFIFYLADQCAVETQIDLPETGNYRVDMIDTWEMTRETVMENVQGSLKVNLPGHEGMAIIATKM
jgi:hypothetical protein